MTPQDRERCRALCLELREKAAKATAGPWEASAKNWRGQDAGHDRYIVGNIHESNADDDTPCMVVTAVAIVPGNATSGTIQDDTAAFMCAARNNIDELCGLTERLLEDHA